MKKGFLFLFLTALIMLLLSGLHAQYYLPEECDCKGNAMKKGLRVGLVLKELVANAGRYCAWATSMLPADGKPPKTKEPDTSKYKGPMDMPDEVWEQLLAYKTARSEWSCMYSPRNLSDGNPKTCWAEGVKGDGIGETVMAVIDTAKPARIWAGLGASDRFFKDNNRPRRVNVYVLHAHSHGVTEICTIYSDVEVLAKREVELKDVNGWQDLPLPAHKVPPPDTENPSLHTFVAVEILSVYPGNKYQDTCISEIGNR